jgi:peroxiredoxin
MFSRSIESSPAPALKTSCWFNAEVDLSLDDFRGRVVVLIAFQMLCPGCVTRSIPLAQRLEQLFDQRELVVVGLHTVFEHHHVMTPAALEVFLAEYRIRFPVGVDSPDPTGADIPLTMQAYQMRGTPTLVLIDAEGRRRAQYFGAHDELALGAEIGALLAERAGTKLIGPDQAMHDDVKGCEMDQCKVRA